VDFSPARTRPPLVLELTPLIDVVFLLLIFFMVSTTFQQQPAGLKVDLPRSEQRDVIPEGEDVTLMLTADGQILVDDQAVTLDELKKQLQGRAAADSRTMVVLKADEAIEHGRVVQVLDLARELGLTRFAIATEPSN
jgi:biopolymer transport protein ExbD